MLGYVRYRLSNNVHEDFLFCRALEGYTTGGAIFFKVSKLLEEVELKSKDCVGVCSDGAAAILGKNVGFHAEMKSINGGPITFSQCIIHREALAAKETFANLSVVDWKML